MPIKVGYEVAVLKSLTDLPDDLIEIAIVKNIGSRVLQLEDGRTFTQDGKGLNTPECITLVKLEHRRELHRRLQHSDGQQPE